MERQTPHRVVRVGICRVKTLAYRCTLAVARSWLFLALGFVFDFGSRFAGVFCALALASCWLLLRCLLLVDSVSYLCYFVPGVGSVGAFDGFFVAFAEEDDGVAGGAGTADGKADGLSAVVDEKEVGILGFAGGFCAFGDLGEDVLPIDITVVFFSDNKLVSNSPCDLALNGSLGLIAPAS